MELHSIIQTSISPVILISGTALFLLTLTNRLGRTIDRTRQLSQESQADQIEILWRRANLLRLSILLASLSALSSAIMIIFLFISSLVSFRADSFLITLFIACLLCLAASFATFVAEINASLHALKLELNK